MARLFSDLNILVSTEERKDSALLVKKIRAAFKLGYEVLALNTVVEDAPLKAKKTKRKKGGGGEHDVIPPPIKLPAVDAEVSAQFQAQGRTPRILNRITLLVTDLSQVRRLASPSVKAYDIVAVQPTTEKTFQMLCNTVEVDVITLDTSSKLPFRVRRQQTGLAIGQGIHFEILYGPALRDSTARRHTICNSQNIIEVCKGRNVILSSGALKANELRGPYDIANLGLLFGLKEHDAKDTVSTNCRSVVLHAESRKTGKTVVSVTKVSDMDSTELWKVKECPNTLLEDSEEEVEEDEVQKLDDERPRKKKKQALSE